ncbi:ParB N-terminal domain-containing protein, partial [Klebsiella pneumoniae]|uniref:ParB N-terminal domain-containing protein n=1 Tax=Klebsiella pneumoniae TaxID=573 RepID=UPI0013D74ED4
IAKTSRAIGLLQPVNVEAGEDGRFRLIAGAKRLAALIKAGEAEIDARVIAAGTLDEAGRRLIEIVEN